MWSWSWLPWVRRQQRRAAALAAAAARERTEQERARQRIFAQAHHAYRVMGRADQTARTYNRRYR